VEFTIVLGPFIEKPHDKMLGGEKFSFPSEWKSKLEDKWRRT